MRPGRSLPAVLALTLILAAVPGGLAGGSRDAAAAEGQATWAVHITLAPTWFDPAETPGIITPFMVLYALHDALVKPMPGKAMAPSLAESWTASKDGLVYEFVLRKNVRFHNGEVMTAEDVKYSFERYRGASAALLKAKVAKVEAVDPLRVRFTLKQPWPDFMTFYATPATGAAWIVPKKYVEQVGEDGFKKAPVGAGPYKFVSFKPGVELTLEAHEQYWRKPPAVKTLVFRVIPDESTRLAALKRGEVDVAYSITGPLAEEVKRSPGLKLVPTYFTFTTWLVFPDQWDPKSPWHDRRVRQAASLAIDRPAINQAEMLGLGKPAGAFVPPEFDFALRIDPPAYDPKRAKQLMVEAGYPNGFDAGDLTPLPPYTSLAEAVGGYLQAIGIRSSVRTMERATFLTTWREKKLHGLLIGATGAAGNAAARLEPFFTKGGIYAYGTRPEIDDLFQRQANEGDRKQREALLHQIQKIVVDQAMVAPIFQQGFIWGVGARVEQPGAGLIQGYPYAAPCEDLKLK